MSNDKLSLQQVKGTGSVLEVEGQAARQGKVVPFLY